MADRREGGPPSLGMVAAGGVGVLVVIAFVAAIALGGRTRPAGPGERVAVGQADASGVLAVFVPRCQDDRVTGVQLTGTEGVVLWRIVSRKGSIDERYVVGAEPPPLGFAVEVPLSGPPEGPVGVSVLVDGEDGDVRDEMVFTVADVPAEGVLYGDRAGDIASFQARALSAAACPESRTELGFTTVLFGLAALGVVGSYGLMVSRWWRGRGGS